MLNLEYDYRDTRYPIPFSQYYRYVESRYSNYNGTDSILRNVTMGPIRPSTDPSSIMLIIGSDTKQFMSMAATIAHAFKMYRFDALTILDYGLTENDKRELQRYIQCLHQKSVPVYYRVFNFDACPTWISIALCATKGSHSYKVISYLDATFEWNGMTLWLEPGFLVPNYFEKDVEYARSEGFYSPLSSDNISMSLHSSSFKFLKRYFASSSVALSEANCMSTYALVNPVNTTILHRVLYPYYHCALTKRCILPSDTILASSRHDQAILSLLVKSVSIPHTASYLSNQQPIFRKIRNANISSFCFCVC